MMNKKQLIRDIRDIGVRPGDLLNIKVSMKAIGWIEGGAMTVIEALLEVLGDKGTLVAESFIRSHPLSTLKRFKYESHIHAPSYAGAVANAMIIHPKSHLSGHPIQRFSAIGCFAESLMDKHKLSSYAYDPLKKMAMMGGKNLTIGKNTIGVGTTHVAIGIMGFKQIIPKEGIWHNGKIFMRDWVGGCAKGFKNFKYKGTRGKIGNANSLLTSMPETLTYELETLRKDPTFFMCGKCIDCLYSWEFKKNKTKLWIFRTYNRLKLVR